MTAALLVVPGVAHADTPSLPDPGSVVQQVEDGLSGAADSLGTGTSSLPIDVPDPAGTTETTDTTAPTGSTGTDTGAGTTPTLDASQLQALLGALGVSADCVTAISGDLQAVLTSVPATVEALLAQLQSGLTDALADPRITATELSDQLMGLLGQVTSTASDPQGLPLLAAVQDLVTDFLATCLTTPAAATSSAPASVALAAQTSAPAAAPAATTSAAPVAYLGYAPTGASEDESPAGSPLLALGGVLLLGAGIGGTWMRLRRGVPSRG